jgi:hypothetical protein
VPGHTAEAVHQLTVSERIPGVVIGLNLRPIIASPAIDELAFVSEQATAFDCLDPRGVRKTESLLTLHKAVALIVVLLNRLPVVDFPPHKTSLANERSLVCSEIVAALLPVARWFVAQAP